METAFKGSSKKINVGPSSSLPHMAEFDVEAMTWDDLPLRRATARTQGALTRDVLMNEQVFSYWDDDGMWVDYCAHTQDHFNFCKRNGRSKTAIYVGTAGYDICLDSMI
eukprot:4186170-Prymnesium_polylepis.2